MESTFLQELEISPLVLGSAQFGLPYGIANRVGQPSTRTVTRIVELAFQSGVNAVDTAAAYGESEIVLGKALQELGLKQEAVVISKVHPIGVDTDRTSLEVEAFVRGSVLRSLENLSLDHLPVCLLHRASDLPYLDVLLQLREEGLVRQVGISLYSPQEVSRAISTPEIQVIQHPTSVLDQRFLGAGTLERAAENRVAVLVRSIYLQGLLLLPQDEIPPQLLSVQPSRKRLGKLAEKMGVSLAELALRFAVSLKGVTAVVVGVETVEQLKTNLQMMEKGPWEDSILRLIQESVPALPEVVVHPPLWPNPLFRNQVQ